MKLPFSGVTFLMRDCSPDAAGSDECADATIAGLKIKGCVCRTDYCDDGQLVKPTFYNVFIGVAITAVTSIAWMNKI